MYRKLNIHFVGIGGIGMSGIAEVLLNLGYPVSGSDVKRSPLTARLKHLGSKVFIGHRAKNIDKADVVVVSSAVNPQNIEIMAANERGVPVIRRAEMLSELMRLTKYGIAVAGTHGKTTTTSLLAAVLHHGGLDPTAIIGGRVNSLRTNAKLGRGPFMVVEADESDGSFLHLLPTIAVVTNIDPDHLENFGGFDDYRHAFYKFCVKIPFHGLVVLCGEHPETRALGKKLDKRVQTYGLSPKYDWNAQNIKFIGTTSHFDLFYGRDFISPIKLNLAGKHNILNALATIAVGRELNIDLGKIKLALNTFKGVARRMEILYKGKEVVAIDDYAHHPAEIWATLTAIKKAFSGRLVVLFQPHRYTRLQNLFKEFTHSLDLADVAFITKIYPAGEHPLPGISSKRLTEVMSRHKKDISHIEDPEEVVTTITDFLKPGDIFVSLGAGDVTKTARLIAKNIKNKFSQGRKG